MLCLPSALKVPLAPFRERRKSRQVIETDREKNYQTLVIDLQNASRLLAESCETVAGKEVLYLCAMQERGHARIRPRRDSGRRLIREGRESKSAALPASR